MALEAGCTTPRGTASKSQMHPAVRLSSLTVRLESLTYYGGDLPPARPRKSRSIEQGPSLGLTSFETNREQRHGQANAM